ncbi:MAG: UDP-N-acetylglucosamine 1-carboxyvinyltransferase [Candidatus Omnitrophota bacterium]
MDKLVIAGGKALSGKIKISGAKNSCLPILAASLLTEDRCVIFGVPDLRDVRTMVKILTALGRDVSIDNDSVMISSGIVKNTIAEYELVSTMRASIAVLGSLLGRYGEAKVSFPGGCVIGPRPIDLHFKGLRALGAELYTKAGYIVAKAEKLTGNRIYLGGHFGSSVLATVNTLLAAVLAKGETIIEMAASEPEIVDLVSFLKKMGADISGEGTPTLKINGVKELRGAEHKIIPDRIETGTFMLAAVATAGRLFLEDARPEHNLALIDKLKECGADIKEKPNGIEIGRSGDRPGSADITTLTYPGFPTDLQAQIMSLVTVSDGISVITEKIYPERFIHISELNRMGAEIILEGATAIVKGVKRLSGAPVMASDLRASAALVIAGLIAEGETEISRVYHLDRGYEHIERKLSAVGADIRRIRE